MPRFRALLVGVGEYDDPGVTQLPFVVEGLGAVGAALESRGYVIGTDGGPGSGRASRTQLLTQVQRFLQDARRGDTLLVFLSGHGAHSSDIDYLIPSDASLSWSHLPDVCVALNAWTTQIENTPADSVIFFVDACREGFDEQVMAGLGRAGWSRGKGLDVARRNVAFVFACAPGESARFVGGNEGFSLFARSLERVASDPEGPSTLAEVRVALEQVVKELARTYNKPAQQIRIRTESNQDEFIIFPPGQTVADRESWRRLAAEHGAWECADGSYGYEKIRVATDRLVSQLAAARHAARLTSIDPWCDMGLARRMSAQTDFLLMRVLDRPKLSSAEAALLVVIPLIYETHWATQAARLRYISPENLTVFPETSSERASFERFVRGYPRLLRRAWAHDEISSEAAVQIGWWLFHRWLARRPDSYAEATLMEILSPISTEGSLVTEIFAATRLSEFIHCLGADPSFLARTDRPGALVNARTVATGSSAEQTVRERLVGYILAVANYLAINIINLPEIIADHVGIADPISPSDLRSTVEASRWEPRGYTRVLNAPCTHPAVEVALRRHVRDLDSLLTDIHHLAIGETDLTPLAKMPVHSSPDLIGPAKSSDGPAYTSAGVRFRLAEDRIQELLMGEQLYGDRTLAIRELYQNALDACRYRQARTEYIQRTTETVSEWQGQIVFEQKTDELGRIYLDCIDNGIGMGLRELSDVFSQAGTRFADLPEFLEEQAGWSQLDPPILLQPNSRFGIGVLSYFMLADEITVTTCRLSRDGLPTRRLQVSIAGPGNLFRIRDLGPSLSAGTTVRLHLRQDQDTPSCVQVLSDALWVSPFSVSAHDATGSHEWRSRELSSRAPVGKNERSGRSHRKAKHIVKANDAPVWWCDTNGRILTDGIASDKTFFGAIVDLTGQLVPPLSVNRRNILDYRSFDVERLLAQAIPTLISSDTPMVDFNWISRLANDMPTVADLITQAVIRNNKRWKIGDTELDASFVGCWPLDRDLLTSQRSPYEEDPESKRTYLAMPDWLAAWRATALGLVPSQQQSGSEGKCDFVPALPSDAILIRWVEFEYQSTASPRWEISRKPKWLDPTKPVPLVHVIWAAASLNRSPNQVAERLAILGFSTPDTSGLPNDLSREDITLTDPDVGDTSETYAHGDKYKGLETTDILPVTHIIRAAIVLRRDPTLVAERLSALGFPVPDTSGLPSDLSREDITLISSSLGDDRVYGTLEPRWLDTTEQVPLTHLIRAAVHLHRSAIQVRERLASLGFSVPDASGLPGDLNRDDVTLIAVRLANKPTSWLVPGRPVPLAHLAKAAASLGWSAPRVAGRLESLGFSVPDTSGLPSDINSDDITLINGVFFQTPSLFLNPTEAVPLAHITKAAVGLTWSAIQVAERLASLGFSVPDASGLPADLNPNDIVLMSYSFDIDAPHHSSRRHGWLDPTLPVPTVHIIRAAVELDWIPTKVTDRLAALGFSVPDTSNLPNDLNRDDITMTDPFVADDVSPKYQRTQLWLEPTEPLSLVHIIRAAVVLHRDATVVAARLMALGFSVPDASRLPADLNRDDVTMISSSLDNNTRVARTRRRLRWLNPAEPVPLANAIDAATKLHLNLRWVSERLIALGYTLGYPIPDDSGQVANLTLNEAQALMSIDLDGKNPWLDPSEPLPLGHMIRAAIQLRRSLDQVSERLTLLGYRISDAVSLSRPRPAS